MPAKIFTSSDYYYWPKFSMVAALYAASLYVDEELFEADADIYVATVKTTVVPIRGFWPATRWVEISTIGYEAGNVGGKLLTRDIWSPGATAPHEKYVDIATFIYGIGLNLFPIEIKVEPPGWPEDVGFNITIQLSILWR